MRGYQISLLLSLLLWGRTAAAGQAVLIDKVVAVVNDDVIMLSEIQKEGKPLIQRIRDELQGEAQASQMQITQRQVLEALIFRRLQLQEAEKEKITVEQSEVDGAIKSIKERNGFASDAELVEVLAQENLTLEEFRKKVWEQIVVDRLLTRHVRTSVVVSEEEVTQYYQDHMAEFEQSPSVHMRLILIRLSADPSPGEVTRAQVRAADALARIRNGDRFEDIAAEYSDGPAAQDGGDLGVIRSGELDPALERAAFSLKPGSVSDVIQTREGLNIIRVEERTTGDVPIDEVRVQVRRRLFNEKMQQRMRVYLAGLREKAYIEIRLNP